MGEDLGFEIGIGCVMVVLAVVNYNDDPTPIKPPESINAIDSERAPLTADASYDNSSGSKNQRNFFVKDKSCISCQSFEENSTIRNSSVT